MQRRSWVGSYEVSWGGDEGEALRSEMKVELSLTRAPLYRLTKAAVALRHPAKGARLRELTRELSLTLDHIEEVLNR